MESDKSLKFLVLLMIKKLKKSNLKIIRLTKEIFKK